MAIPVVVLSLKSSAARRAKIGARLDSLAIKYRFFDAINGRSLAVNDIEHLAPRSALLFDRPLTAGEVGCAATHLAAIRQLADENHDFVCILEDDATVSVDVPPFLESQALSALPLFDVLRLVSDPARWKKPAWQIARTHGRGIYAMSRPGYGLQGQIYSRAGLRKIASQVGAVRAPIDFVLYYDCHVLGLRVLEVRPGLVEHDLDLQTDIGLRQEPDKRRMSLTERLNQKLSRSRRKRMAIARFIELWGPGRLFRILLWWPPGNYFK